MAEVPDAQVTLPKVTLGVSTKLYLSIEDTQAWARVVATIARSHPAVRDGIVRLFVLPSLPAVAAVRKALAGTPVLVGAQDLSVFDRGAYTGEVSGEDLAALGCALVEVGHAERRRLFGEDDGVVARKVAAAVRNRLIPVLCVGETARGTAEEAISQSIAQLEASLAEVDEANPTELIVAYEPVWAIGQAEPAEPEHIRVVAAALRTRVDADPRITRGSIIYGGSAQRGVLTDLGRAVDGLFLGRHAHDPAELGRIIDEAAATD